MSPFSNPTQTTIEVAFIYYQSNSDPPTYSTTKNTTHTTKTTLWFQGTVDHPMPQKTTVTFPDMSTILTPNHQFRFLTLPTSQDISKSTKPLSLPDTTNFPFSFTGTTTTQPFIRFTLKNNLSAQKPSTPALLGMPRSFRRTRRLHRRVGRPHSGHAIGRRHHFQHYTANNHLQHITHKKILPSRNLCHYTVYLPPTDRHSLPTNHFCH